MPSFFVFILCFVLSVSATEQKSATEQEVDNTEEFVSGEEPARDSLSLPTDEENLNGTVESSSPFTDLLIHIFAMFATGLSGDGNPGTPGPPKP